MSRGHAAAQTVLDAGSHRGAREVRVALAGLGSVGRTLAQRIDSGLAPYRLSAVSARDVGRAEEFVATLGRPVPVMPVAELADAADLVVECAPAGIFRELATPVVEQGKRLLVLTVGALLDEWDLVEAAGRSGGEILVPTGALLGLDAVQAAAQGQLRSVRMVTRKPVESVIDAPYLVDRREQLETACEPVKLFEGSAREAFTGFPANLNVAVALSLAGLGPDRTALQVWADPRLDRNTHRIEVESDSADFSMEIGNVPSENPRTGRITALSAIALLTKLASPLRVGT